MDLNYVLIWLVIMNCAAVIFRIIFTLAFRDLKGSIAVNLLLLIFTVMGIFFIPRQIGLIGGALWVIFILLPWIGDAVIQRLEAEGDYRKARYTASIIRWLHPFDGWLQRPDLLLSSELAQQGDLEKARMILERHGNPDTSLGIYALLRLHLITKQWDAIIELLDTMPENILSRSPLVVSFIVRALGERGDVRKMLKVYEQYEKTLKKGQIGFARLSLGAFCGQRELVEAIFRGPVADYPKSYKTYWTAIAEMAAENVETEEKTLTAEERSILARISDEVAQEEKYDIRLRPSGFRAHVTWTLIILNSLMFLIEVSGGGAKNFQNLYRLGAAVPFIVLNGEWWRLFSAQFLHYGGLHITLNMVALILIGPFTERTLGRAKLLVTYLLSGILAYLGVVLFSLEIPRQAFEMHLGASAGIAGIIGSLVAIMAAGALREKVTIAQTQLYFLLLIVFSQVIFDLFTPQVSSAAHGLGFFSGLLVGGFLLDHRHSAEKEGRDRSAKSPGKAFYGVILALLIAGLLATALYKWNDRKAPLCSGLRISLHEATRLGYSRVVELIVDSGAPVDEKDANGTTPLHIASGYGYVENMNTLIERKADVNAQDNSGGTPLHYAAFMGRTRATELLLSQGAKIEGHDKNGATPLHYAALDDNKKEIELLASRGARVNARDNEGYAPLHYAATHCSEDAILILLRLGADINAVDKSGNTPLSQAIFEECDKTAELLIRKGADIKFLQNKNEKGETALEWARKNGKRKIIRLLQKHGIKE